MNKNRLVVLCLSALVVGSALRGMDVEATDLNSQLRKKVKIGDMQEVMALILKGADINAQKNDHFSLMMEAIYRGHTDICKLLIAQGADVDAQDRQGRTALMLAAGYGHKEICSLLVEKGADVWAGTFRTGLTALRQACATYREEICKLLIDAMLKLTKGEEDRIITFVAQKRRGGLQVSSMPPDMVRKVGKQMLAQVKEQNKRYVIAEINESEIMAHSLLKQQLLAYVNEKIK
jgi:hypothetical protein